MNSGMGDNRACWNNEENFTMLKNNCWQIKHTQQTPGKKNEKKKHLEILVNVLNFKNKEAKIISKAGKEG